MKSKFYYLALVLLSILSAAALTYQVWSFFNDSRELIVLKKREFVRVSQIEAPINPILDVKLWLLTHYPSENTLPKNGDSKRSTRSIKNRIYDAFLSDNFEEAVYALESISWKRNPEYDPVYRGVYMYPGRTGDDGGVGEAYFPFDYAEVVAALDTTYLLTAYLYDRSGFPLLAAEYYRKYSSLYSRIDFPGSNTIWFSPSRRGAVVRIKLHSVLKVGANHSSAYKDNSYVDTVIEMMLQQTLTARQFSQYRAQKIIYPRVSKRTAKTRHSSTRFDFKKAKLAISQVPIGLERDYFVAELCLYAAANVDDEEMTAQLCDSDHVKGLAKNDEYLVAAIAYRRYFRLVDRFARDESEEPNLVQRVVFIVKLWSLQTNLSKHLRKSAAVHLRDDMRFQLYRAHSALGNKTVATKILCRLSNENFLQFDFAKLANKIVVERGEDCKNV